MWERKGYKQDRALLESANPELEIARKEREELGRKEAERKSKITALVEESRIDDGLEFVPSIASELTLMHQRQIKRSGSRPRVTTGHIIRPTLTSKEKVSEMDFQAELSLQIDRLEGLNPETRKVLKMFLIDNLTVQEISQRQNFREIYIKQLLKFALELFFKSEFGKKLKGNTNPSFRIEA